MSVAEELDKVILQLGSEGRTVKMQRDEFMGNLDEEYTLMIRDYARDSSEENAQVIRRALHNIDNEQVHKASSVAHLLGYDDRTEDSIMTPLGLRTLSNISVVRKGMADKIVDEYGSLQEILEAAEDDSSKLGEIGVKNPDALANSLHRMWGQSE